MKLSELSTTPKLINIVIDDEDVIDQYKEPIEFWIYDRQSMSTFMKLATVDESGIAELAEVILDLVLDEDGKPMLTNGATPPPTIMMKVVSKVVEALGNSESLTSM